MTDNRLIILDATERTDLANCEEVIDKGLRTFVEVGTALLTIRDRRLYRAQYGTFEDYCQERWGMSRQRANQLVASAETMLILTTTVVICNDSPILPATESQARPLTQLPPEAQPVVWQRVVETAPEGKVTAAHVQAAVNDFKRAENRERRINDIIAKNRPLEVDKRYSVIYADPPWRYEYSISNSREIENHYPTMDLEQICLLPVPDIAAQDAILFMWTTSPKLEESMQVIRAWGFNYRTCLVWVKDKIGMGYYARQRHELLLIAKRGDIPPPDTDARFDSVIEAPRQAHSEKPHVVYDMIEAMYPEFDRIELFARNKRAGWDSWGNQDDC